MATGITTLIAYNFNKLAVVTASVPVTGMPLPFISYGGSSLTITMCQVGILLNISRYAEVKVNASKSNMAGGGTWAYISSIAIATSLKQSFRN